MSSVPNKTELTSLAGDDEFYVVDKSDTTDGASGTGKKATVNTLLSAVKQALQYTFSTTTTAGDPGTATMRFNNATPGSVTAIYIDDESSIAGLDLGTVYNSLDGHRVLIVQSNDSSKFLLAEVTADADSTGYWTLTVTVEDSGTLPDNGAAVTMMVFPGPGGGGGGGKVLQVQSVTKTSAFSTSSTSYTDVTGLTKDITPSNSANKVLVLYDVAAGGGSGYGFHIQLVCAGSAVPVGDSDGASRVESTKSGGNVSEAFAQQSFAGSYLHSPATTSATTYKIQIRMSSGSSVGVNRSGDDSNGDDRGRSTSTITLIEIDGT